jgi:hypothetical protein
MTDQFVQNASIKGKEPMRKGLRCGQRRASGLLRGSLAPGRILRVEQTMHVDDEIAHMRIVDRLLCLALPGRQCRSVVGENTDNIEIPKIPKLDTFEAFEFATEYEVQELLFTAGVRHFYSLFCLFSSGPHLRDFDGNVNRLLAE